MEKEINLRELVERFLKEDERCRTDLNWLCFKVFQEIARREGKEIYIPFELWRLFPSFESIARERRELMNRQGKFNETFIAEKGVEYFPKEKNG